MSYKQTQRKKEYDHLSREKVFDKNSIPLLDKSYGEVKNEGHVLQKNKNKNKGYL